MMRAYCRFRSSWEEPNDLFILAGATMIRDDRYPPLLTELGYGISAVDTDYIRPLMDASHLVVQGDRAAFIDTGTALSVPNLLRALELKDVAPAAVEYVFLTHVHLDHAGGAGALLQQLPDAKVVIHPLGVRHMIDPGKLVAGTIAVYGEENFARLYGEVVPIDEDRVLIAGDGDKIVFNGRELEFIHTRGHANHHYCIVDAFSDGIFSGDSFGLSYRELDTAAGEFTLPTTTPIHFDPEAAHLSIERILSYKPAAVYLTHYSRVTDIRRLAADLHVALDAFVSLALDNADKHERTQRMQDAMRDYLWGRLDEHGYEKDDDRRAAILHKDIELNVMGLEVWLDRQAESTTGWKSHEST